MSARAATLVELGELAVEALGERYTHLSGCVVPYERDTVVGLFVERFARGAFTESIVDEPRVPLLLWHDSKALPIGVAEDFHDDARGLHAHFRLMLTPVAQQAGRAARDGYCTGLSVGFVPISSTWTYASDWNPDRGVEHMDRATRRKARLLEVSVTSTPAYVDAYIDNVESVA